MYCYTESMQGLIVVSCNVVYTLTGNRYYDKANFAYWYETESEVWLLGTSMKYFDGRIR